jgi:hypothetical protein
LKQLAVFPRSGAAAQRWSLVIFKNAVARRSPQPSASSLAAPVPVLAATLPWVPGGEFNRDAGKLTRYILENITLSNDK